MSSLSRDTAPPLRTETVALGASDLAAVFWGTNFEATRIVLQDLPPWTALTRGIDGRVLKRNLAAYVGLGILGVAGSTRPCSSACGHRVRSRPR